MQLNKEKSKVMVFNSSKKHDFMPKLSLETGTNLDVVESYQLLGVIPGCPTGYVFTYLGMYTYLF